MTTNILSIGQSALAAAQVGLATTGHNIANSGTAGYTRQVVTQGAVAGQNVGYGFVGKGTEVTGITRVYSEFLTGQVLGAQVNKSSLDTYYTQIKRIDNLLADPSAGVSPALQDFFKSVQNLAAQPNDAAARQSMLSSSESLAARFNGLDPALVDERVLARDIFPDALSDTSARPDRSQHSSPGCCPRATSPSSWRSSPPARRRRTPSSWACT